MSVTLPVLVTMNVVVDRRADRAVRLAGGDVLSRVRAGLWVGEGGRRVGRVGQVPPAGVPVAVAVLVTEPSSRSAWVTVWAAVQVATAPGARVVTSADRCRVGVVVADGDAGERDVAGVGDDVLVADRVADRVVRVAGGDRLVDGQGRRLGGGDRDAVVSEVIGVGLVSPLNVSCPRRWRCW